LTGAYLRSVIPGWCRSGKEGRSVGKRRSCGVIAAEQIRALILRVTGGDCRAEEVIDFLLGCEAVGCACRGGSLLRCDRSCPRHGVRELLKHRVLHVRAGGCVVDVAL